MVVSSIAVTRWTVPGRKWKQAPAEITSSRRTGSPAEPSSSLARPSCTSQDSSFTRWNCRLSDSPALTKSTLPTYCSASAQISSEPQGLSTLRGSNSQASSPPKFGESTPTRRLYDSRYSLGGTSGPLRGENASAAIASQRRAQLRMRRVVTLGALEVLRSIHGDPESLVPKSEQLPLTRELGEGRLLVVALFRHARQRLLVQHVDPGIDPVRQARRLAEARDALTFGKLHHTELRHERRNHDRRGSSAVVLVPPPP